LYIDYMFNMVMASDEQGLRKPQGLRVRVRRVGVGVTIFWPSTYPYPFARVTRVCLNSIILIM
jgi:hypothetical protein